MFETNMMQNLQLIAIQGNKSNPWRKLVSEGFTSFLDSISTVKQETKEENCYAD